MKNKIVKEKKKNYMTEIKDATIELIKPIFKKYGATTPDKAMLKEEVIAEIEDKRKAKYSFSYLKQLGIIKKYKGKFYYSEENENETSANKNMTKSQKISLIIFISFNFLFKNFTSSLTKNSMASACSSNIL